MPPREHGPPGLPLTGPRPTTRHPPPTAGPSSCVCGWLHNAKQPGQLGKIAVDNALKAVRGEKVEPTVKVPVKVVTKDNVAGFSG